MGQIGQYRQWLRYRDIDRHLHMQREQLVQQITEVQEGIRQVESAYPDAGNSIFQALTQPQSTSAAPTNEATFNSDHPVSPQPVQPPIPPSFPPFAPEKQQNGSLPYDANPQVPPSYTPLPPLLSLPQNQGTLLPDDVNSFLDAHSQTDPQLTIPKWLLRAASTPQSGPLDPQSAQTNKLVQRWLERWGKQLPAPQSEREDTTHE